MKRQEASQPQLEHIKKGNFIDVNSIDRLSEWQIYDLSDTKMHVRSVRDENYKQAFDLHSNRVCLFRTISRPTEMVSSYHRHYCYWAEGLPWALQIIKRVNQSEDLFGQMGVVDIVQFWKGKNYLFVMSLNDDRKITHENSNLILEYVQEFFQFFSRYWALLDVRGLKEKKLYESERSALMLSYPEIMINLGLLLCRKSYLDTNKVESFGFGSLGNQPSDRAMLFELGWLEQKFIPALASAQNYHHLNFEIIAKLCSILLKLTNLNRLERTPTVIACVVKLIRTLSEVSSHTSMSKFQQQYQQINDIMQLIIPKEAEFNEILKCKLRMLIGLQDAIGSYITLPQEKMANMNKYMPFVFRCCECVNDDSQMRELVHKFLRHDNGLGFYIENVSLSSERQLAKLFRIDPSHYISQAIRKRKSEILRLTNTWTPQLLLLLLDHYLTQISTLQKQDLLFSVNIHRLINNELSIFQRNAAVGSEKKVQQEETDKKLKKLLTMLNARVIGLCETFCDAMEKTVTIDYVERNILDSYVSAEVQNISAKMEMKETSNFRENFVYRIYISKYMPKVDPKAALTSTFHKLCSNMAYLKSKSQLESRKQNLIALLTKCYTSYSSELTSLICQFIQSVKKVQNKEFKSRALEFLPAFVAKSSVLFKTTDERIGAQKQFLNAMKIENLNQLRVFFQLFKQVNNYENNIRLTEESNIPLIIYKKPFGLDKLIEGFSCVTDRILIKKLVQFFSKIQFKIADQALKSQLMQQITEKVVEFLDAALSSREITRIQEQYAIELVDLIQSLMSFHLDTSSTSVGFDYGSIFAEKNTPASLAASKGQLLSNVNSGYNTMKLENISKKIRVFIKIGDEQKKLDESDNSNESDIDELFIEVDHDEKLYSVKERASTYFQMSPVLSNLYCNGQKIPHLQQIITVGRLYSALSTSAPKQDQIKCATPEVGEKQEEVNSEKGEKGETEKRKERAGKEERPTLVMILQSHRNDHIVKETLMKKINIIYNCLPYTAKIWSNLQISLQHWQSHVKLIELKEKFIEGYTSESTKAKQYLDMTAQQRIAANAWMGIIQQPLKKKYLFQALLSCPNILNRGDTSGAEWVLDTFNDINNKMEIENNILSIRLMEKLKLNLRKPEDIQKIFFKLRFETDQVLTSQEIKESEKLYEILLDEVLGYIEANVEFNLFHFILTIKDSIRETIFHNRQFLPKICGLLKGFFQSYILEHHTEFFNNQMLFYMDQYPNNFNILVIAINYICWEDNPALIPIFEGGLSKTIKLLIADKRDPLQSKANTGHVNDLLIQFACCLISKSIRCEEIYHAQFRNVLHQLLSSKQQHFSLHIITCLISESVTQSEHYVNYFRKEMNEPEWDKKDYIKFNRSNLRPETGFVGLFNPHSICYVNSLLQQLYHIESFRRELYLARWKKHDCVEEDLIYQLKKIFINLNFRQCEAYINRNFFEAFKNDEGSATSLEVQMDVDEFRNILLDRIENMIIKPQREGRNFVQEIFNGKQLTIIKSKDCCHESSREEEFSSICLEVKGLKNLGGALQHYFKPEILNEDNKYFCEDCNKKVVAQKRNVIKEYPRYLTFVLKRFEYIAQIRRKINERFQFPLNTFQISEGVSYSLKGVIVHQGLSEAGHYFSLIKVGNKWYEFNDNQAMEIYEANVINYGYGESTGKCNKNAYLLIYQKVAGSSTEGREWNINEISQFQFGLDQEIGQIKKHNSLVWKSSLFFSRQFDSFVENAVKNKIEGSISMLFQYTLTIRAKYPKTDMKIMRNLFELLQTYSTSCLLSNESHVEWAIKFYRNSHFNPSMKSALTNIIASKYQGLNDNVQKFLASCLVSLHEELETSPFYYLFYRLCQIDVEVLKFLVSHRIIGRIYDISFPDILLTMQRQEIARGDQINFPLTESHRLEKKKSAESSELRYHKWQLINYVIKSGVQLHRVEKAYIESWVQIKCQQIFEEATCKANINQISQFFTRLSTNNQIFSTLYLTQICQQIAKDRSEHLRKYLKAAFDILNINDSYRMDRFKKIKQVFAESFRKLYGLRILSSFDVKWQWFIKILFFNTEFRNYVRACADEFKILLSKNELNSWYFSRNEFSSEGKFKNKYYGLKFSSVSSTNIGFLEEKIERTKLIFDPKISNTTFKQIYHKQYNFDTTIIDFPLTEIRPNSVVLKYFENASSFKQVTVDDVLGDLIQINEAYYDIGDEKFMRLPQQSKQLKVEEESENMGKMEDQVKNEPKIESDLNQFGV